jgi:hypothetical protein
MSIGAGGGAQTAGVAIDANGTSILRSPDRERVAVPVSNGLAGPGDAVGVGDTGEAVGVGDPPGGGGDTLIP